MIHQTRGGHCSQILTGGKISAACNSFTICPISVTLYGFPLLNNCVLECYSWLSRVQVSATFLASSAPTMIIGQFYIKPQKIIGSTTWLVGRSATNLLTYSDSHTASLPPNILIATQKSKLENAGFIERRINWLWHEQPPYYCGHKFTLWPTQSAGHIFTHESLIVVWVTSILWSSLGKCCGCGNHKITQSFMSYNVATGGWTKNNHIWPYYQLEIPFGNTEYGMGTLCNC